MEQWDKLPDGLMIASPANPTGAVLSTSELADICKWCDSHGVRLISDEIYHGLAYGHRCDTALNHTKNAIIVNSMSKYFSMTGWRIGWIALPDDLVVPVEKLAQNLFISAPTPNQRAAIAAFDCTDELDRHVLRYAENRDILLRGLPRSLTEGAAPCEGAFYLFVDISQYSDNSVEFASLLLAEQGTATTPGLDFDPISGHRYLRLSFAGSTEDMHEAVRRINSFIAKLSIDAA
jgi:aspartate/methionine/tyrosine aminotransferase